MTVYPLSKAVAAPVAVTRQRVTETITAGRMQRRSWTPVQIPLSADPKRLQWVVTQPTKSELI